MSRFATTLLFLTFASACADQETRPIPTGQNAFQVTAAIPSGGDPEKTAELKSKTSNLNVIVFDGTVVADVMALKTSERGELLIAKFKEGVSKDPDWWLSYASQTESGKPLPFHKKMGLSKGEYNEMLGLMENLGLQKLGEASLDFRYEGNGRLSINSPQQLEGVVIDFENDVVETPYGTLLARAPVNNDDPNSPTGAWSGPSWHFEEQIGEGPFGTVAKFSLGRRDEDQRGIIYYNVRRIIPDSAPEKVDVFLYYSDPKDQE